MRRERLVVTLSVCLTIIIASTWFVRAGSITPPPGPVAGTMHTLEDIFTAVTGGGGGGTRIPISSLPFTISAPGSYVVTADLVSTGTGGITVLASDVTIDLGGHDLTGVGAGPAEDAIATPFFPPGFDSVTVFNGSIHGWGGDGVDLLAGKGNHVSNLTVESCGGSGVLLGTAGVMSECVVRSNAGDGIVSAGGCRIVDTVATSNGFPSGAGFGGGDGIYLAGANDTLAGCVLSGNFDDGVEAALFGSNNTAHDCTAESNGFGTLLGSGFDGASRVTECSANSNAADGIVVSHGVAINCVANGNGAAGFTVDFTHVSDCEASANSADGILAVQSRIRDCNVTGNVSDGIEGSSGNFISGNNANGNGASGIMITGPSNTIENNHCVANAFAGIDTTAGLLGFANGIFANRATGNPAGDYLFDFGANTFGPIVPGPGPVAGAYNENIAY